MNDDADNIIGLYQRHAVRFATQRSTTLVERGWLDRFLAQLGAQRRVLDLGCGFGKPIAEYLLEQGAQVTGVDSSEALIAMARAHLPGGTWHVEDMRGLDLDQRFDGLLAWDSSFHLTADDQRAFIGVLARHAAPGAALLFTSGPEAGERLGVFEGERLFHASLAPDDYIALLAQAGFEVLDHVSEDPNCGGHTVWLARQTAP